MSETIAVDPEDTARVSDHLRQASTGLEGVIPSMPDGAAFGVGILAASAAAFASSVTRSAAALQERWSGLGEAVQLAKSDVEALETAFVAALAQLEKQIS